MGNNSYVLDANIFLEYIYNRHLSDYSRRILQDAVFITNDTRYIFKVKKLGHIQELQKYKS